MACVSLLLELFSIVVVEGSRGVFSSTGITFVWCGGNWWLRSALDWMDGMDVEINTRGVCGADADVVPWRGLAGPEVTAVTASP